MATSVKTAPHPALISGTLDGLALEGGERDYAGIYQITLNINCYCYY